MNNKVKVLIGIAVAVLVPLSLFILAKQMSKDRVLLPKRYNIENILDNGDTVYKTLKDIKLVNQLYDTVSILNSNSGKAVIFVVFDFVKGETLIDSAEKNIRVMQKSFLKKIPEKFHFVSIIVNDSNIDTRVMSDRVKADHDRWWFVKGENSMVKSYVNELTPQTTDIKQRFNDKHTIPMILIDSSRQFRGYYNALDPTSLKQCADDAILIILEKKRKKK